jgi:molecular chaperone HtpG
MSASVSPTDNIDSKVATPPTAPSDENKSERFAFSADINQLLSLIINTFYSNKDIFLRELISNASDALDKIRYQSLTNPSVLGEAKDLDILIIPDPVAKTLTIRDFGIGMTRQDLINNLGTIAKSGTKAFMEALQSGVDVNMIGQFGVGFYSAFLVANEVEVYSKHNDEDKQYVWKSTAGGTFSVEEDTTGESLERGTKLVLHLKDDMENYLKIDTIRGLIRKQTDFIDFLIKLRIEKTVEKEVTDDEAAADEEPKNDDNKTAPDEDESKKEETKEGAVDDVNSDEEKEPAKKTKKVTEQVVEWEPLNFQKPLWTRKPADISPEEYAAFYKAIANDYEGHQAVKHFSVEGQIEFKSILFIPKRAPFDLYDKKMKTMDNIKLYVRRVFIMDKINDLYPQYLCFIKGVVDSEDLPLNISREMLQQNKVTRVIKKHLIKKSLDMIESLAEDKEEYKTFYNNFGKNLKLGIHEDTPNRTRLTNLLRFPTANTHEKGEDELMGFQEYVDQMKENQKGIYYITGESIEAIQNSPFVERVRARGFDVFYMVDPMDEYCMNQIRDYAEKPIICITKEGLDLGEDEEEKKQIQERAKELDPLCIKMKEVLGEEVEKVIVSSRLEKSPCVLVTGAYGWTANMERLVKAQCLRDTSTQMQQQFMACRKTLEINPDHPVVKQLESIVDKVEETSVFRNSVCLMYQTSLISSGFTLPDPSNYASKINNLIGLGLGIELEEEEDDIPELENEGEAGGDDGKDAEGEMEQID